MEVADNFLALKLETVQIIMAFQDSVKLQKVRALLGEAEPTPQYLLDRIDRARAEAKTDVGPPWRNIWKRSRICELQSNRVS